MSSNGRNGTAISLDFDPDDVPTTDKSIVQIGGKLPYNFQVDTSKLLDVIVALSPQGQKLDPTGRKQFRKRVNEKLYNKTRPGFYLEVGNLLHIAYAGQPGGAGTQHRWYIYCGEELKAPVETILAGTALVASGPVSGENHGNYSNEWGGMYLRSEAEVRIAEALDRTGLLFFANARGRVGLQDTVVSNSQLPGRVEADFLVFYQGQCMILEVDGQHHSENGQTIRDYARDRVLLRSGVPTVRFTAKDCLQRPHEVVSEFTSILTQRNPSGLG